MASSGLCKDTEFILNFLLVAARYDAMAKNDWGRISQLTVSMEEVELDAIIMQWASMQFSGIKHIAALQDVAENLAASQEELSFHRDQDESKSDTKDPDQENCCAIGALDWSIHGVSSDTATFTGKDWIMHASTCMPMGNHRPHETKDPDQENCCAIGAPEWSIHGVSSDTATCT